MKKYFAIAIVAILLILAYQIISPYLITLITAFILAYLIKPLFLIFSKKINKSLSAIICILLVILIIVVPIGFLVNGVTNQATEIINQGKLEQITTAISSHELIEKFDIDLFSFSEKILEYVTYLTATIITKLPSIMISLLILVFGIFYFLIGWDEFTSNLKKYLPFKDKDKAAKEIKQLTNALIYGSVLISMIELLIALVGFYFIGVGMWIVLPILIFFLAFIPALGPTLVWVPLAIYYFIVGNTFTAVGVVIIGFVLSYLIDTVLRAKILGKRTGINPFIMLIGIIGGITVFGIFGFIIGPLILFYTIKIIQELIK